ncbi:hypothetical protein OF83DRAFT_1069460 [Amylostereum chailletii]|nr:hypothetical protein OF83DRAFT_1069460 [Amylostereum chailletii]
MGCSPHSDWTVSLGRPRIAPTLLDNAMLENLKCRSNSNSIMQWLQRATNMAFPAMVKSRYKELLRVSRQWRIIQNVIKFGGANKDHWEMPTPGEHAWFCVACPQVGFNLPEGWEEDEEYWKYTRYFALDGNFHLQHLASRSTADDHPILPGSGFMVRHPCSHLATTHPSRRKVDLPECHDHRARNKGNLDRHNLDITGVVVCCCTRHGCMVPKCIADLQKGEK